MIVIYLQRLFFCRIKATFCILSIFYNVNRFYYIYLKNIIEFSIVQLRDYFLLNANSVNYEIIVILICFQIL